MLKLYQLQVMTQMRSSLLVNICNAKGNGVGLKSMVDAAQVLRVIVSIMDFGKAQTVYPGSVVTAIGSLPAYRENKEKASYYMNQIATDS